MVETSTKIRKVIGNNRILMLNIFKYVNFKRKALMTLGRLCRKYSIFVKKDITMFEMFEKEKQQFYVTTDVEFSEFINENINPKDYFIELYLRVKFLPMILRDCKQVRVRDLTIIFDNTTATRQTVETVEMFF